MMKILITVMTVLMLASCAGYFDASDERLSGRGLQPLAIAGGGYISTDNHNEITPYLYRDTNASRAWLFFSSDREGGKYHIYVCEMYSDGLFSSPVLLTASYSATNQEFSPVVFNGRWGGGSTVSIFIAFARLIGNETNIYTVRLNSDFSLQAGFSVTAATNIRRLSLLNKTNDGPTLLAAYGETNWHEYLWNNYDGGWYPPVESRLNNPGYPVTGADGFYKNTGFGTRFYLLSVAVSGRQQLFGGSIAADSFSNSFGFYPYPDYQSVFNDKDPFVDPPTSRAYFSSDRYGRGNFDLYRYNLKLFGDQLKTPPVPTVVSVNYSFPDISIDWIPVPGALFYRVLRCYTNIFTPGLFTVMTDMNATNLTEDPGFNAGNYYYKIQAIGDGCESTSDYGTVEVMF